MYINSATTIICVLLYFCRRKLFMKNSYYPLIIILLSSLSAISLHFPYTRYNTQVPSYTSRLRSRIICNRPERQRLSGPSAHGSRVTGFVLSDYVVVVVVVVAVVVVIVIVTMVGLEGCGGVLCMCV